MNKRPTLHKSIVANKRRRRQGGELWRLTSRTCSSRDSISKHYFITCHVIILIAIIFCYISLEAAASELQVSQIGVERSEGGSTEYRSIEEICKIGSVLWLGEALGNNAKLYRWAENAPEEVPFVTFNNTIDSIEALATDGSTLWLSSRYGRLYKWERAFDPQSAPPTDYIPLFPEQDMQRIKVKALCWDNGILWIGTGEGALYSWDSNSPARLQSFNPAVERDLKEIKALYANQGRLWIGTYHGLYLWDRNKDSMPPAQPIALPGVKIRSVCETGNILWVGTETEGLKRFYNDGTWASLKEPQPVTISKDPQNQDEVSSIKSLYADGSTLWVGTKGGLYRINGLGSDWAPDINVLSSGRANNTVTLVWKIAGYDGRTAPDLVYQEVVADKMVVGSTGKEILFNPGTGEFTCVFTSEKAQDDLKIEIRATDLIGKQAIKKISASGQPTEPGFFERLLDYYDKHKGSPLFWLLNVFGTYLLGVLALLVISRQSGSAIVSKTWLSRWAMKPLLITPKVGRRLLFLGYAYRIAKRDSVTRAAEKYFGLPFKDPSGKLHPSDLSGDTLHNALADSLKSQQVVVIVGKGGAGKSTALGRLTYLAIKESLPASLKGFIPLLIPAASYSGKLTKAIAETLRDKDGVNVNEEVVTELLQSSKFLILFDGVSEVGQEGEIDKQKAFREIIKTAQQADYSGCRFIVATRPFDAPPADVSVFTLLPLDPDTLSTILVQFPLDTERKNNLILQLRRFGKKPVDPLLFSMMIEASDNQLDESSTRAHIYERYFKKLLRVENKENQWGGWKAALEMLAKWSLLDTGQRGVGLPHEPLIDLISGKRTDGQVVENLLDRLSRNYGLRINNELDLLDQLEAAGLLQRARRWRFAHDTFEEYFAASYIASHLDLNEKWPPLDQWTGSKLREQEFLDVIEFVREMLGESFCRRISDPFLPQVWIARLGAAEINEAEGN